MEKKLPVAGMHRSCGDCFEIAYIFWDLFLTSPWAVDRIRVIRKWYCAIRKPFRRIPADALEPEVADPIGLAG